MFAWPAVPLAQEEDHIEIKPTGKCCRPPTIQTSLHVEARKVLLLTEDIPAATWEKEVACVRQA